MSVVVGVDTGGTFTDLLLVDGAGKTRIAKVATTPDDQSKGFLAGLAALRAAPEAISLLVHATTVGTNTMLERKGAVCGMLTTRGFRDVLELGRRTRPHAYGLSGSFEALVERQNRLEIPERIDADGNVIIPLDEQAVREAVLELSSRGVNSLIIHFIHSYVDPTHEQRAAEIARELMPDAHVISGSEILREVREFERGTAAAINGYISPAVSRYLLNVEKGLQESGFRGDFLVMQGNGGMASASQSARLAINTVMSGPAAGAIAAGLIGQKAGFPNLICCDMGGTSFDVTLVLDGEPSVSNERDLAYGLPIRVPMVDVHTISAGGGSIARVDKAGMLRVGPDSSGSFPGPICFGRGGREPTITDANLVLGRLDASSINGADVRPSVEDVAARLRQQIGVPLGLSAVEAAAAVVQVATNDMASAINLISVARGHDPRDFALFAFGGAGPLHAVSLARELGIPTVLVPPFPGITSAIGSILADIRHDQVRTVNRDVMQLDEEEISAILRQQGKDGEAFVWSQRVPLEGTVVEHSADFLYEGQSHVLSIRLSGERFDRSEVVAAFREKYHQRFAIDLSDMRLVLVNLRTTVIGKRDRIDAAIIAPEQARDDSGGQPAKMASYFGGDWYETPVYSRQSLPAGRILSGPAIIKQIDTTIYVDPRSSFIVDQFSNIIITVE